jgi:hypothetical protein
MAVVAALDLDDEVPAGKGAHQVDGVHRGLGAGVAEPPLRQAPAPGQLARHRDRVLGRLSEVSPPGDLAGDRGHDRGMAVARPAGPLAASAAEPGWRLTKMASCSAMMSVSLLLAWVSTMPLFH